MIHTRITQAWQAPFPPPEIMKKYDEVVENGARRLFQMFEEETKHRREMERLSLNYQGRDLVLGKWLALAFCLAVLAVVSFAIWNKAEWVAAVLGAAMLTTIAIGFFRVFGDGQDRSTSTEPSEDRREKI